MSIFIIIHILDALARWTKERGLYTSKRQMRFPKLGSTGRNNTFTCFVQCSPISDTLAEQNISNYPSSETSISNTKDVCRCKMGKTSGCSHNYVS